MHYSYERSEKQLMVLDIQGCGYTLFDPEVLSKEASSEGEYLFCTGNLHTKAIEVFTDAYVCNQFCKLLGLTIVNRNTDTVRKADKLQRLFARMLIDHISGSTRREHFRI